MKTLTKLTAAQEALLPEIRDEWLGHGLCTDPADRTEAQHGVADAYRAAGLEPPAVTVWLDSPLAGAGPYPEELAERSYPNHDHP